MAELSSTAITWVSQASMMQFAAAGSSKNPDPSSCMHAREFVSLQLR